MTTMASQAFMHALTKENIKALRHWPLWGEFTGTGEFPAQRASNAKNVSIWWRHCEFPQILRYRQNHCYTFLASQAFMHALTKENIKAPRHWPLWGEFTGTGEFPAQKASNAENVSIWWRHREFPQTLDTNHCYTFLNFGMFASPLDSQHRAAVVWTGFLWEFNVMPLGTELDITALTCPYQSDSVGHKNVVH